MYDSDLMESGSASIAGPRPTSLPRGASASWSGWINVVVGAVIMLATLPGRTQGLGLITEPMLGDLRLDRVAYASINLWATLLGAAICLPIGRVFDRLGLRMTTVVITLLLAVVVWTMSQIAGGTLALFLLVLATARPGPERAFRLQHHRGRQVVRSQRRRRHGRLLVPAQRVLRRRIRRRRQLGARQRLAHGVGAGRAGAARCGCRDAVPARAWTGRRRSGGNGQRRKR